MGVFREGLVTVKVYWDDGDSIVRLGDYLYFYYYIYFECFR